MSSAPIQQPQHQKSTYNIPASRRKTDKMGHTYISILKQGLVVEAKNLVHAPQVGVLDDKVPVGVVLDVVEVVDG